MAIEFFFFFFFASLYYHNMSYDMYVNYNRPLSLSLSKSKSVFSIRNLMGAAKKTTLGYNTSVSRNSYVLFLIVG